MNPRILHISPAKIYTFIRERETGKVAKATLIWFRGNDKPFKTISLGKRSIYAIAATVGVMAVASIALTASSIVQASRLGDLKSVNERYEEQVRSQEEMIGQLKEENVELDRQNRAASAELDRVHTMELQVKRFLGLEPEEGAQEHGNQGGTGPYDQLPVDHDTKAKVDDALKELGKGDHTRIEPATGEGLSEVLTYLQDKQEHMRDVPTILPVDAKDIWISCDFGWRDNPMTGSGREYHNGLDIAGPWKSPIIAPADGVVVRSGKDTYLGEYVKLKHSESLFTAFGHMSKRAVKAGQKVKRGEVLGYMGNTGRSTGTHVHYAVIKDNRYVDPALYIWDGLNNPLATRE